MKKAVIIVGVILVLVAPYPFPLSKEIQIVKSPDGDEKAIFYWRGSGLLGYISKDNPWVYLKVINIKTDKERNYSVWADTPCDGVERLKTQISWSFKVCGENEQAL